MRVLVVDDSATMRTIIRRCLVALGIDVCEAAGADAALDLFRTSGVDIILTDRNMPGKSGLELARSIRQMDPAIPILMITTAAEKSSVLEALAAGVTDYVVKPFATEVLKRKLEHYVAPLTLPA